MDKKKLPDPGGYVRLRYKVKELVKEGRGDEIIMDVWPPCSVSEWNDSYIDALHRRINSRDKETCNPRGRDDSERYMVQERRDQHALQMYRTKRIVFYYLETKEARKRFGHLIEQRFWKETW